MSAANNSQPSTSTPEIVRPSTSTVGDVSATHALIFRSVEKKYSIKPISDIKLVNDKKLCVGEKYMVKFSSALYEATLITFGTRELCQMVQNEKIKDLPEPPSKQSKSKSELQKLKMENDRLKRKLEDMEELHTQKGHFIVKLEQRIVELEEKVVELESQVKLNERYILNC